MKKTLLIILLIGLTKIVQAQGPIKIYWTSVYKADTGISHLWEKDKVLLKTAEDLQEILNRALGYKFDIDTLPNPKPATGIFLIADTNIVTDNMERCTISSDSLTYLTFTAKHAHGVTYGVYEYLHKLGCRFYLPGADWEVIPELQTPFMKINEDVTSQIRMRTFAITGGLGAHPADSTNASTNSWNQWIYRNNMRGEYEIAGHNDWADTIRKELALIDCSIAEHDSSVVWKGTSVVNVENSVAVEKWANWMTRVWKNNKRALHNDPFVNTVRSIDLPDASGYGNTNIHNCVSENGYDTPSNQRFRLENRVTEVMQLEFPGTQTWCLSYDLAADTPSVPVHDDLNVSVTMGFQNETSNIALMKRWLKKMKHDSKLSEYNYMPLPYYGIYPYIDLDYFKKAFNRMKVIGTGGSILELGIAKFATAFHAYAFNSFCKTYKDIEETENEFINTMFGGAAAPIKELFTLWADESVFTKGILNADNKHRYPKYFKLITAADGLANTTEKKRIAEIKAYIHYMILNDKFMQADSANKMEPAKNLAHYVVQISKMNIINPYAALIMVSNTTSLIVNKDSSFYYKWNPDQSHTKWDPVAHTGSFDPSWLQIPYITDQDIQANFEQDMIDNQNFTENYNYVNIDQIISKIPERKLKAKSIISYAIQTHTIPTQTGFTVYAPSGGYIRIMYDKLVSTKNNDVIFNFSLDSENQLFSTEKRINSNEGVSGFIDLSFDQPGYYQLFIGKSTYGGGEFQIVSNGNYIFRNGSPYPTFGEIFTSKEEAASYVYVPKGVNDVFLSIMGACGSKKCIDSTLFNENYIAQYRNNNNDTLVLRQNVKDSTLFYLPVKPNTDDNFWQIYLSQANAHTVSLANINNYFFWLEPEISTGTYKNEEAKWSIFPNPSHGTLNLVAPKDVTDTEMTIVDVMGRTVFSSGIKFSGNTYQANLDIPTGLYIINLKYGDQTVVKKWINK